MLNNAASIVHLLKIEMTHSKIIYFVAKIVTKHRYQNINTFVDNSFNLEGKANQLSMKKSINEACMWY